MIARIAAPRRKLDASDRVTRPGGGALATAEYPDTCDVCFGSGGGLHPMHCSACDGTGDGEATRAENAVGAAAFNESLADMSLARDGYMRERDDARELLSTLLYWHDVDGRIDDSWWEAARELLAASPRAHTPARATDDAAAGSEEP